MKAEHPVIANADFTMKHRWLLDRPPSRTMTAESCRLGPTISFAVLGGRDGGPNPNGRRRHVHVIDAELFQRIDQRVDHRGGRRREAPFAAPPSSRRISPGPVSRPPALETRESCPPRPGP